jgi:hypothetical protein
VTFKFRCLNFFTVMAVVWLLWGCERATTITIQGDTLPIFVLSGNGNLSRFSVYVVSPVDIELGRTVNSLSLDSFFSEPALWQVASPNEMGGMSLGQLGSLKYGTVPPAYKQTTPGDGSSPPALVPGRTYFFECSTTNASGARGAFQLINGRFIPAQVSLPCLRAENGKEVTVSCLEKR